MNNPQIARLRVLADIIEEKETAEKLGRVSHFNMADFASRPQWYGDNHQWNETKGFVGEEFTLRHGSEASECGTKLCVAGFATLEAGYSIKYTKKTRQSHGSDTHFLDAKYFKPNGEEITYGDGRAKQPNWEQIGGEILGLTPYHAHVLFFSTGDDGEQAIEILTKLALGEEITDDEWLDYKYNHNIDNDYSGYGDSEDSGPYAGEEWDGQRDWADSRNEDDE